MLKHTKIVATVSDQRCDVEFIDALYKAGMNVVRLNTAHMDAEGLSRVVNNVRAVSNRIGILMDTKGPEVRTTLTENKEPIYRFVGKRSFPPGYTQKQIEAEQKAVENFVNRCASTLILNGMWWDEDNGDSFLIV